MHLARLCSALLVLATAPVLAQEAPLRPGAPVPMLSAERTNHVDYVWFSGQPGQESARGGADTATVTVKPNPSGDVRVAVFEEFSGGAGSQWRASVWMSSFLASSTLGRTLTDYEFGVSAGGFVDGPSAGGLTTAALMATMLGMPVDPEATMTGSVNPDGTIGPVGGIPQKIAGAAAKGKKRFGFPVGQRYDTDLRTMESVDLDAVAGGRGMAAREVRDVYDAFQLLTGKELPRPVPLETEAMELPKPAFELMKLTTRRWFTHAREQLDVLRKEQAFPPLTQSLVMDASTRLQASLRYQAQGLGAMAYSQALEAAALADMAVRMDRFARLALQEDFGPLMREVEALSAVKGKVAKTFAGLEQRQPKTATGALTLLSAYSAATAAWAFTELGLEEVAEFDAVLKGAKEGRVPASWQPLLQKAGPEGTERAMATLLASKLMPPLIHFLMAEYSLQKVEDAFVVGYDSGAPLVLEEAALQRLARTYLSAAKANLDYYDSLVLSGQAEEAGVSLAVARGAKATQDGDYRFAMKLMDVALRHRKTPGTAGAMTVLSASLGAWLRGSSLVANEYSLGVVKEGGSVKEVKRDKALMSMLELAERKAREHAAVAREVAGVVPVAARARYLEARVRREGSPEDKLTALYDFWNSSAMSQIAVLLSRAASGPDRETP